MTKKRKRVQPDADGILRTGIYQRRVASEDISSEEAERRQKAFIEQFIEQVEHPPTIRSWLDEWLECCAKIIRPHIDDSGRRRYSLNLGDGWKFYRLTDEFADHVQEEQTRDAIECMNEVRSLLHHIGEDDKLSGNLGWVVHASFRLGRKSERLKIRPFEHPAKVGIEAADRALERLSGRRTYDELKREAEEALEQAKRDYPDRGRTFRVEQAAKAIGIGKSAFYERLKSEKR